MARRRRGRPKGSKNRPKQPVVKITTKKMTDKEGIYTSPSESSYESKRDIQVKKMYEGQVSVSYPDRYITDLTFEELHEDMVRRNAIRREVENREYYTTIEVETDHQIGLVWWADVHKGNFQTDLERLKWEADEIKLNPYLKVALGGDFADSFCWNPAQFEDTSNLVEQRLYLYRLIEYIGYNKVLFAVVGNHEKWSRGRGLDMYGEMRSHIPVFDGVGTVDLRINNIPYMGAAIHKARGSSYLDPNFGGKRFLRENDGYDFVMTAHNHNAGSQTINRDEPNCMREAVVLAGKTFKSTDDFHDTEGMKRKTGVGLGSNGIIFDHKEKEMLPVSSMSKMLKYISK